jgi:hypothetical protein
MKIKNNTIFIIALLLAGTLATTLYTVNAYASTSEEEDTPPEEDTTTTTTTTVPPAPAPAPTSFGTSAPTAPTDDFVRTRLMLFGIPPDSPNIVAWINVPSANATSADTITSTELDATNNVTGDGIGEMFISLPNVSSQVNQQVEACALDVVNQMPQCDNAFTASTNSSTILQIMLNNPQQQQQQQAIAGGNQQ